MSRKAWTTPWTCEDSWEEGWQAFASWEPGSDLGGFVAGVGVDCVAFECRAERVALL